MPSALQFSAAVLALRLVSEVDLLQSLGGSSVANLAESWAEDLACGERYGVVRLRNKTVVVLSWSQNAQRWSVVDAGPCREVVISKYADPAVCNN